MAKFQEWVKSEGGALEVAKKLGVERSHVLHWMNRDNCPRPQTILKIEKLSKGKLTARDILVGSLPKNLLK